MRTTGATKDWWLPDGATHNIGGHVPNPPEDCKWKFHLAGIWWCDSTLCSRCDKIGSIKKQKGSSQATVAAGCKAVSEWKSCWNKDREQIIELRRKMEEQNGR